MFLLKKTGCDVNMGTYGHDVNIVTIGFDVNIVASGHVL